jgi:hypothetical protein
LDTNEDLKKRLFEIKEKGDLLIEDLEIITISLKLTKDRFSKILKNGHDEAEQKIIILLNEQIDLLLEKQKKIRSILYERIVDCYQASKTKKD